MDTREQHLLFGRLHQSAAVGVEHGSRFGCGTRGVANRGRGDAHLIRQVLGCAPARLNNGFVFRSPGGRNDDPRSRVGVRVVVDEFAVIQLRDALLCGAHGTAQAGTAVDDRIVVFVENINRVVSRHREFVDDDFAFTFELHGVQKRIEHHVAQHFGSAIEVVDEAAGVVGGVLLCGHRVGFPAEPVEFPRDVLRGALPGSLEQHVLKEVGGAGSVVGFASRS